MSFKLPDLIMESIIRDGFNNARQDPSVIDDVFSDMTMAFANQKYGNSEIEKIKTMIQNREVNLVHSFNLVPTNLPCISIQLSDDRESEDRSHLGYYVNNIQIDYTTPEQLASLVVVPAFQPISYDALTGAVRVSDAVNLSQVHVNLILVDSAGVEHKILGSIVNESGKKQVGIEIGGQVNLGAGALIKSSINYNIYQHRGNIEQTQLILGIHSKDALITKYLYTLVKYFTLSRRDDLISRGMQLNTYTGSDFNRNLEFGGDVVFSRFFNVSAMVQHQWQSDKVQLVDNIQVNVKVDDDL